MLNIDMPKLIIEMPMLIIEMPKLIIEMPMLIIEIPRLIIEMPMLIIEMPRLIIEMPMLIIGILIYFVVLIIGGLYLSPTPFQYVCQALYFLTLPCYRWPSNLNLFNLTKISDS